MHSKFNCSIDYEYKLRVDEKKVPRKICIPTKETVKPQEKKTA